MLREVYMGDETREILRNGSSHYEEGAGGSPEAYASDIVHDRARSRRASNSALLANKPLSPLSRNLKQGDLKSTSLKRTAGQPDGSLPISQTRRWLKPEKETPAANEDSNDTLDRKFGYQVEATTTEIGGSMGSPRMSAKRRRTRTEYPELDLELDYCLDDRLENSARDCLLGSNDNLPSQTGEPSYKKTPTSGEAMSSRVETLSSQLLAREDEIRALRAEMLQREDRHQVEMEKVRKDLHHEYSKQASEKLRVIVKRLEASANERAEREWEGRVSELSEIVEKERKEKAELVQACDEYLRLKGF